MSWREFALLVVLYMFDPAPVSPADAAYHLGEPRTAVLSTLRRLQAAGCIVRTKDPGARGAAGIKLSRTGRSETAVRLNRYVSQLVAKERELPRTAEPTLPDSCATLREIAQQPRAHASNVQSHRK